MMNVVLRAYDHDAVVRAETHSVDRLHTLLSFGGLREPGKVRVGLSEPEDEYARETLISRLEDLKQEGYAEESLARLRGEVPIDLSVLRRKRRPVIEADEAVALREDLVRYLTYGLWEAPEEVVARALGTLTGQHDALFLLGNPVATAGLQEVLDTVGDDVRFNERYGPAVRAALTQQRQRPSDAQVQRDLQHLQQLLGPAARLLRAARDVGLRVIAYQDARGSDGLTRYLAADLGDLDAKGLRHNGRSDETLH